MRRPWTARARRLRDLPHRASAQLGCSHAPSFSDRRTIRAPPGAERSEARPLEVAAANVRTRRRPAPHPLRHAQGAILCGTPAPNQVLEPNVDQALRVVTASYE